MQLHQIKPKIKKKGRKRIGRGGKRGSYSGRGIKGQKARAGRKIRPQWRDTIKKIPKKRGYRFAPFKKGLVAVGLDKLEKHFNEGEKVTPQTLFEKGIIRKNRGLLPGVKLLADGEISKKFLVSECQISGPAKEKVERVGGKIL